MLPLPGGRSFAAAEECDVIRAVIFDLDETLITRREAIRAFIRDQYGRYRAALAGISESAYVARFLDLEQNGVIGKDVVYPALVRSLGIAGVGADELLEDYRKIYPGFAVANPGAVETIKAIRERGLKTGVLTNGNARVQEAKLSAIGVAGLLDAVVISESAGLKKPDPAIFRLAADRLGVPLESCLFVGDNPETDIVGAATIGMQTAWFRNGATWPDGLLPRADVDIDSLEEVLHIPGR